MAAQRKRLSPRRRARVRADYENSDKPLHQIAREAGICRSTLATMARREDWRPRRQRARSKAEPAETSGERPDRDAAAGIARSVKRELAAIDAILASLADGQISPAAERTARTLASLTRTLKEVQRLRSAEAQTETARSPSDAHDDDMPRDIDEFRRELARRIDAFVASRTDAGLPGPGEQ